MIITSFYKLKILKCSLYDTCKTVVRKVFIGHTHKWSSNKSMENLITGIPQNFVKNTIKTK